MPATEPDPTRRLILRRRVAYLCVLIGVVPLACVAAFDLAVGTAPCPLCLWERWPYRAVVAAGLVGGLLPRSFGRSAALLCLAALAASAGLAVLHVGVEHRWWRSPLPACLGGLAGGALPARPAAPCDRPVFVSGVPLPLSELDLTYGVVSLVSVAAAIGWRRRLETREGNV